MIERSINVLLIFALSFTPFSSFAEEIALVEKTTQTSQATQVPQITQTQATQTEQIKQAEQKPELEKVSDASSKIQSINPEQIEAIIQNKLPEATVGIVVQDVKTGKVLYERNSNKTFAPASGLKIFTAAAALQILGPEYQFKTSVKIDKNSLKSYTPKTKTMAKKRGPQPVENKNLTTYTNAGNELTQNVFVEFSGDPSLDSESFKLLLKTALEMNNIKKISGKVIIDDTLFQGPHYPFGWSWNSLPWYFSAPISTVILNENRVKLSISSNHKLGEPANISFAKDEPLRLPMSSDVVSVTEEAAERECSLHAAMDEENRISLRGCWPKHETPETLKLAVKNPVLMAKALITEALNEMKIEWTQEIAAGKAPKDAEILEDHLSMPLKELLKPMLQDSNNLYAESVFKTIGVKKSGTGTFLAGIQGTKEVLTHNFGLKEGEFRIEDGSGGSRYTMITPHQMAEVLYGIQRSPNHNAVFLEALPSFGETGTLKNRTANDPKHKLFGKVHAKTGSMMGVSSLSGYLTAKPDQDLIFVIMINNTLAKKGTIRSFEDELLMLLMGQ